MEIAAVKFAARLHDRLAEEAAEVEKLKVSIQVSSQVKHLAVIEATICVKKERGLLRADLDRAGATTALEGWRCKTSTRRRSKIATTRSGGSKT